MDKLKLFEITFNKLADDEAYMAHYLRKFMILTNKPQAAILQLLNCTPEEYYKLALCQVPPVHGTDFKVRLKKIAAYSNTSETILLSILGYDNISQKNTPDSLPGILSRFKNKFPSLTWLYQPLLTTSIIVLFVIPAFSKGNETANLRLYIRDYVHYTDSMKYIHSTDQTAVFKSSL